MTTKAHAGTPQLEFWFDFGSNYSYLSTMRIEALAARHGLRLVWRPFLLGPIFKSFGWSSSPFVLQKEKGEYMWRDMERECAKYGLAWTRPSEFPRRAVLPLRVAVTGAHQPWIGAYCKRMMTLNFADDRAMDDAAVVSEVLRALGLNADAIIEAAQSDAGKLALREQGEEAKRRKIFGAPTFFVGDEMFWGNDRLDDAIACALGMGGTVA